jgi:hypothetical protein
MYICDLPNAGTISSGSSTASTRHFRTVEVPQPVTSWPEHRSDRRPSEGNLKQTHVHMMAKAAVNTGVSKLQEFAFAVASVGDRNSSPVYKLFAMCRITFSNS